MDLDWDRGGGQAAEQGGYGFTVSGALVFVLFVGLVLFFVGAVLGFYRSGVVRRCRHERQLIGEGFKCLMKCLSENVKFSF